MCICFLAAEQVPIDKEKHQAPVSSRTKVLATPAVRSFASKKGVDICQVQVGDKSTSLRVGSGVFINAYSVQGSGPDGRVMKEDVLNHVDGPGKSADAKPVTSPILTVTSTGQDRTESIKGIRKVQSIDSLSVM